MFTRNRSKSVLTLAGVAMAALLVTATSAHAEQIYLDDFSGGTVPANLEENEYLGSERP